MTDADGSPAEFIPFSPPLIEQDEIDEVIDTLKSDWITTGPKTRRFEAEFAERVGAPAALALNSCTAGLHLALAVSGIGPGDEVIVPTMTFCATANVIEHVGATPVFVDVDDTTLNLDPDAVEAAISPRTRAISVVHYAGHPAAMRRILEIASRHSLQVVEDAAHALPASWDGNVVGSSDRLTAFSFYATKNLTTAEGGMLTGDRASIDRARTLSLHGMDRNAWNRYGKGGTWFYEVVAPGFKYNLTDLQSSLGLVQLRKLSRLQSLREERWSRYDEGLSNIPGLRLPTILENVESARHLYVVRLNEEAPLARDQFVERMQQAGVGCSVHFIPVHRHPYYRDKYRLKAEQFPVAERAFREIASLPLAPAHTLAQIDRVVDAVRSLVAVPGGAAGSRTAA
ncbi:MAG TPA: DegT/DnrJ/EryC1/StrS family aminotransferase [Pirellulaceae bacterium]|jgi:dTDP-4-amino-4,6-dideoxygalactose transaminase|nr:DegT/DnrJ/EryC1/StrS family aminotransferase [Pirellulaceae bacterium]